MVSGGITHLSDRELRRLDVEAVRLRRHRHRERLRLGEILVALDRGFRELGFRHLAAYARERLSLGARWCADTRAVARRLAELPRVRGALVTGAIGWAMAELLSRHATADDEAELLEACRGETVRAARRILRQRGEEPEPEPEVEEQLGALSLTLPVEQAAGLEAARRQVEHINGGPGEPGSWLEYLLMESHARLLDLAPEAFDACEDVAAELRGWIESRRRAEARNVEAEERARPTAMPPVEVVEDDAELTLPSDPVALDRMLRHQARRIASGDVWLGRLLEKLFEARAWKRLGYATETQYALDRLGMSRSAVRQRIRLTRKARWLDGLDDAIQSGRVGTSHASLIARVADPDTLEAWIERATRRTYKHLAEEVELADLLMRFIGDGESIPPPDEDVVARWERIQADWLGGSQMRRFVEGLESESDEPPFERKSRALECGDDEPVWQRGAHVEEVEAALAAILRGREGRSAAVQMSGGSEVDEGSAGAVQMSGGSELDDGSAGVVQMSGGCELDGGPEHAVQMSGGCGLDGGPEHAVQVSGGSEVDGGREHAVQMSGGSEVDEDSAGAVQMSGGSEGDEDSANVVQMSRDSDVDERAEGAVQRLGASGVDEDSAGAVQMSGASDGDGRAADAVQMSVGFATVNDAPSAALLRRVDESARRRRRRRSGGTVSVSIVARNDVVLFFRELEAVFARSGLPGTFVELMLADFWVTWAPAFQVGNKWKPIHDRDRHQCRCPVCSVRRSLSNHHIVYRARGGGDEIGNQIVACDFCHLDGEHGGRLRVRGTADRPVWTLGRTPIVRVEGREKIELGDAAASAA